jgi:hypothetical protein
MNFLVRIGVSLLALFSSIQFITQSNTIDISGSILNTNEHSADQGLVVTLQVFEGDTLIFRRNTTVDADNNFLFSSIEVQSEWSYTVFTSYDGVKFSSRTVQGNEIANNDRLNIDITVYSSTTDDRNLLAERVHVFINFSQTGVVRLTELYTVINSGNDVIIPAYNGDSNLKFTLPTGAINMQIQSESDNSTLIETDDGFFELANIYPLPAQHQVLVRYDLPYENQRVIRFIMPMNIETAVFAIPYHDVKLESNELLPTGTRMLEGEMVRLYMANDLEKGQVISVKISGKPGTASVLGDLAQRNLFISIVFFVPIFLIFIGWLINSYQKLRKKKQRINDLDYEKETILDEIVALDDLYRSNQLAIDVYQNRRNELLLVLKEILQIVE